MADKRHIIHPHIERVTGNTQNEINQQLNNFFLNVPKDNILYDDQDELNKGILVIDNDVEDPSIYIKDNEGNVVKISGNGSKDVDSYNDALSEATEKNIGQIFYVKEETIAEDGTKYSVGPYIVIGEGEMMKLASSLPSGDVEGDVGKLKTDVNNLQNSLTHLSNEVAQKVDVVEDSRLMSNTEGKKLERIEEGAQVNVIERILVNDKEMPITNKTLSLTIDVEMPEVESDGRIENAYIDDINGKKYLVLTFTESANAEDILVDVSEMFTEQYASGNGISIENAVIAVKLGKNEKILGFDADGNLILKKDFVDTVNDLVDVVTNHSKTLASINEKLPQLDTLVETVEEQSTEIETIKTDLSNFQDRVSLKNDLIDENINNLNEKFNDYTTVTAFEGLEDTVKSNRESIAALSATSESHEERILGLTETANTHSTKFMEINEDITRIGEVVVDISGHVDSVISGLENSIVIDAPNYVMAKEYATNENIGQIIHLLNDSELDDVQYLKGYYFVEGEGVLSFIITSDGTQDEIGKLNEAITALNEKTENIDVYTVNGYAISKEGGVLIDSKDVPMGEVSQKTTYQLSMVNSDDTVKTAIKRLENSLAATVIAMTASLNDLNTQLNKILEEKYVLKSEYDALVKRVEALENTEKGE